jgi:hypothetical protein
MVLYLGAILAQIFVMAMVMFMVFFPEITKREGTCKKTSNKYTMAAISV